MRFVSQLTIVDHNFGFEANKFLQHLGFLMTSSSILTRKRMDKRKLTPSKAPKKSKRTTATPGPDYQPGNF